MHHVDYTPAVGLLMKASLLNLLESTGVFQNFLFNFQFQLLSVYFLNIGVSQLTKRIQDLQKYGDVARLRMSGT